MDATGQDGSPRIRFAVARINGLTTLVEVDVDACVVRVVELGDGVVRLRVGELLSGGRVRIVFDQTTEQLCQVEVVEDLPLAEELPRLPGPVRARREPRRGFGSSSATVLMSGERADEEAA